MVQLGGGTSTSCSPLQTKMLNEAQEGTNSAPPLDCATLLQAIAGDQMVLLDGGCELHGYCSDVTRTWPVGGKYRCARCARCWLQAAAHDGACKGPMGGP